MATEQEKTSAARRQKRTGVVSSISGSKTIRVDVEDLVKHPRYGKFVRTRTRLAVHDEKNEAKFGDTVEIVACRRLSKSKSWRLTKILRQAVLAEGV